MIDQKLRISYLVIRIESASRVKFSSRRDGPWWVMVWLTKLVPVYLISERNEYWSTGGLPAITQPSALIRILKTPDLPSPVMSMCNERYLLTFGKSSSYLTIVCCIDKWSPLYQSRPRDRFTRKDYQLFVESFSVSLRQWASHCSTMRFRLKMNMLR